MAKQPTQTSGTSRAVRLGLTAQVLALVGTPVSILLIATHLTPQLQGYYFTMSGLLALQIFFDLGLSLVLTQFFSHEFVNLRWRAGGHLAGDRHAKQRVKDILSRATIWFGVAAVLLGALVAPLGALFFNTGAIPASDWLPPWLLAVAGIAVNLLILPLVALESGSGNIAEMSRREVHAGLAAMPVAWGLLATGVGLYAVAATSIIRFAVFFAYFLSRRSALLRGLRQRRAIGRATTSWRIEIWPMQWRVSISYAAGYLVLQFITPVVFHFHGAGEAGRMGMSIAAFTALATIGLTIANVRAAHLGHLVASGNWGVVDPLFSRTFIQGASITLVGALAGTLLVFMLQRHFILGERFIPYWQMGPLLFGACLYVAIAHFGVYLRAYKRDPLMVLTVAHGVAQGTATLVLGHAFGTAGIALSIPVINALVLPWAVWIWWRCRQEWQHADERSAHWRRNKSRPSPLPS